MKPGDIVYYVNGDKWEFGVVKQSYPAKDCAAVYYHTGDTASMTPFECLYAAPPDGTNPRHEGIYRAVVQEVLTERAKWLRAENGHEETLQKAFAKLD